RLLLMLGAAAEDGIEPEPEKGRNHGQDDDFDDHFACPIKARPRSVRRAWVIGARNRCQIQMNNTCAAWLLPGCGAFSAERCGKAMAVLARGPGKTDIQQIHPSERPTMADEGDVLTNLDNDPAAGG